MAENKSEWSTTLDRVLSRFENTYDGPIYLSQQPDINGQEYHANLYLAEGAETWKLKLRIISQDWYKVGSYKSVCRLDSEKILEFDDFKKAKAAGDKFFKELKIPLTKKESADL